jgi:hypothetical protein
LTPSFSSTCFFHSIHCKVYKLEKWGSQTQKEDSFFPPRGSQEEGLRDISHWKDNNPIKLDSLVKCLEIDVSVIPCETYPRESGERESKEFERD